MSLDGTRAWGAIPGGVRITVRVTPRGGRDAVEGIGAEAGEKPHLKLRIAAAPVDGAANEAVEKLLAKWLGAEAGDIEVVSGESARTKLVEVDGDPVQLIRKLQALTAPPAGA